MSDGATGVKTRERQAKFKVLHHDTIGEYFLVLQEHPGRTYLLITHTMSNAPDRTCQWYHSESSANAAYDALSDRYVRYELNSLLSQTVTELARLKSAAIDPSNC